MKKFSKINENHINGDLKMSFDFIIKEETANDIIQGILKIYPHERVLEIYGHEKAIYKYVTRFFDDRFGSLNIRPITLNDNLLDEIEIDNDEIEQLFLDDLSTDQRDVDNVFRKINEL